MWGIKIIQKKKKNRNVYISIKIINQEIRIKLIRVNANNGVKKHM